jgi:ketosteroid isomerase-like protein
MSAKLADLGRPLGALVALAACHASPAPPARHAELRASLIAADDQLAAALAGGAGLAGSLAADAAVLRPGAPLALGAAAPAVPAIRLHRVAGDASEDGQLGYTFGWVEAVRAPDGPAYGKYLAAWQRTGARWQLAAWVDLASKAPPTPPPADAAILAGAHGAAKPGDPAAARDQALAADAAFSALSVAEGYTIAFPRTAAPEVAIVGAGDIHYGPAGVAKAFAGWTPAESLAWTPRLGRAAASGDLAFTVGEAVFSTTGPEGVDRHYTKYLTVWTRQPSGAWQFLLDAGNDRPAP